MATLRKRRITTNFTKRFIRTQQNVFIRHLVFSEVLFFILLLVIFCGVYYAIAQFFFQGYISPVRNIQNAVSIISYLKNQGQIPKEIIGFIPSWSLAQNEPLHVEYMTQVIYFGLAVNPDGQLVLYDKDGKEVLEWHYFKSDRFQKIKQQIQSQNGKVVVAIKNFDNDQIDSLISNPYAIKTFIKNIKKLVREYGIDGINIDFEYFTDSSFPTRKYLVAFLETVHNEMEKEQKGFILSFDLNATVVLNDHAYDMKRIGGVVDHVILMAYDYRRWDATYAGPVAPLYGDKNEHSIHQSVQALLKKVPAEKVILAIPFYGYEWQTEGVGVKSKTIYGTGALATYKRVKSLLAKQKNTIIRWDAQARSPWISYTSGGVIKQIYFENERSIKEKVQYHFDNKLGGISIWALGYEGDNKNIWEQIIK